VSAATIDPHLDGSIISTGGARSRREEHRAGLPPTSWRRVAADAPSPVDTRRVVVRFSRSASRCERQGVLIEGDAVARAEPEWLSDPRAIIP